MITLLRLLPHLYYFLKEMYRLDHESPASHKKRFLYRTIVTILIILLAGVIAHDYNSYRDHVQQTNTLTQDLVRYKKIAEISATERSRTMAYEREINDVKKAYHRLYVRHENVIDLLDSICNTEDGYKCNTYTTELIDKERLKLDETPEHTEKSVTVRGRAK